MDLQSWLILVTFIFWAWLGTKTFKMKSAASAAILACEDEIKRLRRGILMRGVDAGWQDDSYEHGRQEVLSAVQQYRAAIGLKGSTSLDDYYMPSFQRQSDLDQWGPRSS